MCRGRNFDQINPMYNQPMEEEYEPNELQTEWPFDELDENMEIIACKQCYYPITFESFIIDKVTDFNITIGLVVPISHLLDTVVVEN